MGIISQLLSLIFVLTALLMLGVAFIYDGVLAVGAVIMFMIVGEAVALRIARQGFYYCSVLLGFHVLMAAFVGWVYINRQLVIREAMFYFSTFTDFNLQRAILTLVSGCLVIFLTWIVFSGKKKIYRNNMDRVWASFVVRINSLPSVLFQLSLIFSFILAVIIFVTNSSVLDVPYPFQAETQWAPWTFQKIIVILSVVALGIAHVWHFVRRRRSARYLLISRVNFLIVSLLMLFTMGARGFSTFLWLGFGVLEFVLAKKHRGSMAWCAIFVGLAWFAFNAWPYMRWNLSQLAFIDVFIETFRLGLLLGDDTISAHADAYQISLGSVPMIGASLFHLLYVLELINDGVSLGGAGFINLIPQMLPSWLDGVIFLRPTTDGWLLADYYTHGGGFLVIASAYWNGGLAVALVFMGVLTLIFVGIDRYFIRVDAGILYRVVYWLWLPIMLIQLGYGLLGLARIPQLLWAMMLLDRYLVSRGRGSVTQLRSEHLVQSTPPDFTVNTRK